MTGVEDVTAVRMLAQTLSDYGLWGIVAVLCVVVTYLFRELQSLQREIRTIQSETQRETLRVLAAAEATMRQWNENQRGMQDLLRALCERRTGD